jgi:two-component system, OmpR family, sensor histidine kinase CiaH
MFKEARIKLTLWYLVIVMSISLFFSGVIYLGINNELARIESFQKVRIQRIVDGFPNPIQQPPVVETDAIAEARLRIIATLGFINLFILIVAGLGGYFLAGETLQPIAKMVDEQKEFVGNASHELRTPLTVLKTEIEVALRSKKLGINEAKKLLESNLEDVNRMQKLSNYLLKLHKYENKDTGLVMKKVDLKDVVSKAAELVGNKNIKTDLKKSIVVGDEDSLVEMTTILIDNAIKYGGKTKSVEIRTKSGGKIEIQDFGVGISQSEIPHIFDRFYRGDKSRNKEGYGLGLSIAKSIVDAHKGKIEVISQEGKGSTFRVVI